MTCWFYVKGKNWVTSNVSVLHTGIWPSPEIWYIWSDKSFAAQCILESWLTCTASHVQGLASVWMQSCHGHSCELSFLLFAVLIDKVPVGSVNGIFLASVGLAIVIICIILRPGMKWMWLWQLHFHSLHKDSMVRVFKFGISPVHWVPVLLVVELLLIAPLAVQLLLLLRIKPPMRWQWTVSALLGLELLQFGERENSWNARKERREVA